MASNRGEVEYKLKLAVTASDGRTYLVYGDRLEETTEYTTVRDAKGRAVAHVNTRNPNVLLVEVTYLNDES